MRHQTGACNECERGLSFTDVSCCGCDGEAGAIFQKPFFRRLLMCGGGRGARNAFNANNPKWPPPYPAGTQRKARGKRGNVPEGKGRVLEVVDGETLKRPD